MVKAIIGGQYIATKQVNGTTQHQVVNIVSLLKLPNKDSMVLLHCVHRLYINDLNPLPIELWDIIISYIKKPEVYYYTYGIFGFHEGYCNENQLRNLTDKEQKRLNEGYIFGLPQGFYHSIPTF